MTTFAAQTASYVLATRDLPKAADDRGAVVTYIVDCADKQGGWLCDTWSIWPDRHVTINGRRISRRRASLVLRYFRTAARYARKHTECLPWAITRYKGGIANTYR